MSFANLVYGSATRFFEFGDTRDCWYDATADDVFVLDLRNGQQFKIINYNDNGGENDFEVGRPAGALDYVNFSAFEMDTNGTFTIAHMDGTPAYTFTNTGGYINGCFRITYDGTTLRVEQDAGDDSDDSGFGTQADGNYSNGFDEITTLYEGPICFLSGTAIATAQGWRAIESLAIGDVVITASGARQKVKWIGRMSVRLTRFNRSTATPVCIEAGAFGDGLPARDLFVSADHAFLIDDVLVNAGVLVNGSTIRHCRDYAGDVVEYFQIELEHHDLILAEGIAAETFLEDGDNRARFDNALAFHQRYPDATPPLPMPYGRVSCARHLPHRLRDRFLGRKAS